ncbi:MAG TPA: Calx-beta domain-containing protein, partial [Gaiellaceae bacterium]|nr:Calx-beta domain-containing protein [Gaiellaceae bacterium]
TFPLTLSAPAPAGGATVDFATRAGSAAAVVDFKTKSGTATFAAGQTSANVGVRVVGDTTSEGNEQFYLDLTNPSGATLGRATGTGTIVDDEGDASGLSLGNAKIVEGDSGTRLAAFTIRLSETSASTVTVDYATSDGSATQPADYTAKSGTATIPAGAVSALVTVPVAGDTLAEGDETFSLTLSNPNGAAIVVGSAVATIADDDDAATHVPGAPTLSVKRTAGVAGSLTLAWSEPSGRGSLITSYSVEVSSDGTSWGAAGSPQQRTLTHYCGSPSVTCYYRVSATNNAGTGPYSNVASATTYGVPGAPTVSAKRGPGAGYITVSWTKPATDGLPVTGYTCEMSVDGGATWGICGGYSPPQQSGTVYCGTPKKTCWFRISAGDDAGTGPFGNTASATTYDRPSPPTVSGHSGPDYGQVSFSWNTPSTDGLPVTGYTCEGSIDGGATWGSCGGYTRSQHHGSYYPGEGKGILIRMYAGNDAGSSDVGNTIGLTGRCCSP